MFLWISISTQNQLFFACSEQLVRLDVICGHSANGGFMISQILLSNLATLYVLSYILYRNQLVFPSFLKKRLRQSPLLTRHRNIELYNECGWFDG